LVCAFYIGIPFTFHSDAGGCALCDIRKLVHLQQKRRNLEDYYPRIAIRLKVRVLMQIDENQFAVGRAEVAGSVLWVVTR